MGKELVANSKIHEQVITRIKQLETDKMLTHPKNYSPENAIQAAWLIIGETKDRNKKPALEVCTKESIAQALMNMVIQGLSASKKQGYFIVRGNKLCFDNSYFGDTAVVERISNIKEVRPAEVITEGQKYKIGRIGGVKFIEDHEITLETLDAKISGAYCEIVMKDGSVYTEIMNKAQIQKSWNKSQSKQAVHNDFPDQMAKKTVTRRACKFFMNKSDDSDLLINAFNESSGYEEVTTESTANQVIEDKANSKEFVAEYEVEENVDTETGEVSDGDLPADEF